MRSDRMFRAALAILLLGGLGRPALGQAKQPAAPPASPAPTTDATPPPAAAAPDEGTVEGKPYTYDPAGRRDPFRSLLVREKENRGKGLTGLASLSVDEIELEGIWKTRSGFLAQIKGADNRSYLLRRGDLLYDGEVLDVRPNELVLRQNVNDPQSVKPFRDVVKRLNAAKTE
jgi:type IV pilus assembly protein PilP